jgi:plasmid stabilization system protein ParE
VVDVLFHPEAGAEYDVAVSWYRLRSARAATRFEAEVERVPNLISTNPETYPKYDDEHRYAVLRHFPFSVVYHIQPGKAYVVGVAHSSRSPGYWQGRMIQE